MRGKHKLFKGQKIKIKREGRGRGKKGLWLLSFPLPQSLPISSMVFTSKGSFVQGEKEK